MLAVEKRKRARGVAQVEEEPAAEAKRTCRPSTRANTASAAAAASAAASTTTSSPPYSSLPTSGPASAVSATGASSSVSRCNWGGVNSGFSPTLLAYHDTEWGTPLRDDNKLFEFLVLGGFQAGLSWSCVLNKRDAFRQRFANFDIATLAKWDADETAERLCQAQDIIRNRNKLKSVVVNAKVCSELQQEHGGEGGLSRFLWSFVPGGLPVQNPDLQCFKDAPTQSPASKAMAKALKKKGAMFVGPVICYAYMQTVGMVNDHEKRCFRKTVLCAKG